MNNSPQRAAKGFTRAFWVSNTVELLNGWHIMPFSSFSLFIYPQF